jgi:acetamidase/formamidase
VGDPHLAQGDGEVCGTAIEASLDSRITVDRSPLVIDAPVLETATHWYTHGFHEDLDVAMRQAVERLLVLVRDLYGLGEREAYTVASVAADVGVTQVVDGNLGCHAGIPFAVFE